MQIIFKTEDGKDLEIKQIDLEKLRFYDKQQEKLQQILELVNNECGYRKNKLILYNQQQLYDNYDIEFVKQFQFYDVKPQNLQKLEEIMNINVTYYDELKYQKINHILQQILKNYHVKELQIHYLSQFLQFTTNFTHTLQSLTFIIEYQKLYNLSLIQLEALIIISLTMDIDQEQYSDHGSTVLQSYFSLIYCDKRPILNWYYSKLQFYYQKVNFIITEELDQQIYTYIKLCDMERMKQCITNQDKIQGLCLLIRFYGFEHQRNYIDMIKRQNQLIQKFQLEDQFEIQQTQILLQHIKQYIFENTEF